MQYSQLIRITHETGLSPEQLSTRLNISNMTYRRWMKRPPGEEIKNMNAISRAAFIG